MCDASALLATSIALTVIGGGVSAYSSYQQVQAQNDAIEADNKAKEMNAQFAESQAQEAETQGDIDANNYRKKVRQLIGDQKAGYAAAGVDVTQGTPVDIYEQTATTGEFDALTIKRNAQLDAWGYRNNAAISRAGITSKKSSPGLAAVGSVFNTVTPLASSYMTKQMNRY